MTATKTPKAAKPIAPATKLNEDAMKQTIETTDTDTTDTKTVTPPAAPAAAAPAAAAKPTAPAEGELTEEQKRLANELAGKVRDYESQGSLATFAQARALQIIRDQRLYTAIQSPTGNTFSNFGDYLAFASTKSPSTISQNISVVSAFSGYSDEQLAQAGPEKLYVAWKMKGDGYYATLDEALNAAITKSRSDLMALRKSMNAPTAVTVYLSALKVPQAHADRFTATFQKFKDNYGQAHNDPAPLDVPVLEYFLDVVGGLPNDFLLMAAAGQGGAAPEMEGGFRPTDITPTDAIYHIAEVMVESGIDPQEVIDQATVAIQGLKDRYELLTREKEAKAREDEKVANEKAKAINKSAGRLRKAVPNSVVVFADGAEALVKDTQVANDAGEVKEIWLQGLKDGTELVINPKGEKYNIDTIAAYGVVEIKPPAKEKAPKKAKEEAPSTLGMSKEQQSGRKPKKAKATPAADEGEGNGEGSSE